MSGKYAYYETHFKNYGIYYLVRHLKNNKLLDNSVQFSNIRDSVTYKNINEFINSLPPEIVTEMVIKDSVKNISFINKNKNLLNFKKESTDNGAIDSIKRFFNTNTKHTKKTIDVLLDTTFINKVPVEKFMEGLKFDNLFEKITFFDRTGVYYNSNPNNLPDITNPESLYDSTGYVQGGVYRVLKIRGEDKHIMILPIDFAGKRYLIAGIISDPAFKKITQTINSWLFILAAGILLLVFVGMPVLKTMFIGPKERLKTFDVSASGISILFGSALFVLIIISIIKHQFVDRHELSERIEMISENLSLNVTTDLKSIKELGFAISQKNNQNEELLNKIIKLFESKDSSFYRDELLKNPFPLNEIILIDTKGIVRKAYTRTPFSNAMETDLSERQYFKNITDNSLAWQISEDSLFYIESIKSYNTGYQETAVSFYTTEYGNNKVLAITSKIPSLYNQVLPNDIQFVMIDKTGKVLYHSNISKNLHENFIEECNSNPEILKAMQLKIKHKTNLKYNEKRWLARIVPIKDTELFHITLLDVSQTYNKNARIFLMTFFLIIGLQIFTIGCIILFIITFPNKANESNFLMFLKWLSFYPANYNSYRGMLVVLGMVASAGILSFIVQADVVNVLLLQVLSVGFTFFTTFFFFNRNEIRLTDFFRGRYFPENLIFTFLVFLIFLGFARSGSDIKSYIPFVILLVTALAIPSVYLLFSKISPNTDKTMMQKSKRVYLAVLFFWLAIFSVIPVIHSYFSVKHFEEKLWNQQQFFKIAEENKALLKADPDYAAPWADLTRGNGIDRMSVIYLPEGKLTGETDKTEGTLTTSEKFYAWLPNPVKNGFSHRELLVGKKQETEWTLTDSMLIYPAEGKNGYIKVEAGDKPGKTFGYFVVLTLVFLFASVCIWKLVKFAASVFLNLGNEKQLNQDVPWIDFLKYRENKRILLKSFNGNLFLEATEKEFDSTKTRLKKVETIHAEKLLANEFDWNPVFESKSEIIWIYGINECIAETEKHNFLLNALSKLNHYHNKKIVIDLPFEPELLDEYYDDYIAAGQLTAKDLTDIFKLRKRWKVIFEDYISYNGFLTQGEVTENETKLPEEQLKKCRKMHPELCFFNIWKNLTNYEKIVLYDLADDGLLNRNNRKIINQLTEKKLIVFDSYPGLFSSGFRDFIYQHITKNEIKTIEEKLEIKGSWKNAKYLILMILIPLAIFIFISQGMTIEKSFGIFAGIVGAITALMKLFESSVFSSK